MLGRPGLSRRITDLLASMHSKSEKDDLSFEALGANLPWLPAFDRRDALVVRSLLNLLGVHTALMGNHDFDFGVDRLKMLVDMCDFPWLLSNVNDKATGRPLADGAPFRVFTHGGWKIGLVGIVELEWLATLATVERTASDAPIFGGARSWSLV